MKKEDIKIATSSELMKFYEKGKADTLSAIIKSLKQINEMNLPLTDDPVADKIDRANYLIMRQILANDTLGCLRKRNENKVAY